MSLSSQRYRQRKRRLSHTMDAVEAAAALARIEHKDQKLKYGRKGKYFLHCKAVSEPMNTPDEKIVAFIHDVVEDYVKKLLKKYPHIRELLEAKAGKQKSFKRDLPDDTLEEEKSAIQTFLDAYPDIRLFINQNPDLQKLIQRHPVVALEEAIIRKKLKEIRQYFLNCGHDKSHLMVYVDDLTKRLWEEYKTGYIERNIRNAKARMAARSSRTGRPLMSTEEACINVKVKKCDTRNNRDDKRYLAEHKRKANHHAKLALYDWVILTLDRIFPDIILRYDPRKADEQKIAIEAKRAGAKVYSRTTIGVQELVVILPNKKKMPNRRPDRKGPRIARVEEWKI